MANRNSKFLLKRSNTPGKVPLPGDLLLGELALNTADVILYTSGTTANQILPIGWDRLSITGGTVNGNVTINGITTSSGLTLTNITNATGDFITITNSNVIRRRTPSEVLSDIGGQAALTNPVTGTGTTGQVSFWNGTTTQTGDNGLFWDNTNKRLGIGITSPARSIDVESSAGTSVGIRLNSTGTGGRSYSFFSTNNGSGLGGGKFGIYDDTAQLGRIVLDSNGNVGFATNSDAVSSRIQIKGAGTTSATSTFNATNSSGTSLFFVRDDGNVGIGTTAPLAKLDILGNTDTYAGMAKIYLTDSSTNTNSRNWSIGNGGTAYGNLTLSVSAAKDGNAGDNTAINVMMLTPSGNVGIGIISPSQKLDVNGYVRATSGFVGNSGLSLFGDNSSLSAGLFVTTAGNVGIGTTSPDSKLHVYGNTQLYAGSAGNSPRLIFGSETSLTDKSIFLESYYMVFQGHNNEGFKFQTTSSAGVIANRMSILGNGNVGIGTTSPSSLLSLSKTGLVDFQLSASDQATDEKNWVWQAGAPVGTGVYRLRAVNDAYTNGVNALTFTRSGISSVTATFSSSVEATSFIKTSGTSSQYLMADGSVSTLTNPVTGTGTTNFIPKFTGASTIGNSVISDTSGVILIGGSVNVNGENTHIGIDATGGAGRVGFVKKSGLQPFLAFAADPFLIAVSNSTTIAASNTFSTVLSIATSGAATFSSSVTALSGIFGNSGTGSYSLRIANNDQSNVRINIVNSGSGGQEFSIIGGLAGVSNAGFSIYDNTNAATRMYINSSGNVGIGTTSPDVKLSVAPSTDVSAKIGYAFIGKGTDAGLSGWAAFGNINMQAANQIALAQDGSGLTVLNAASGQNIRFRIANVDKVIIDSAGNVGIGTTSPQAGVKLDVYGATAVAGGSEGLRIGSVGDNSAYDNVKIWYAGYNSGAPRLYLTPRTTPGSGVVETYFHLQNTNGNSTTSNNTMGLLVDGNVGIGTTAPASILHVVGTESRFGGVASGFISVYNATGRSGYIQANGATDLRIASDSDPMTMYVNGSERLRITSAGNVGIGTTSPGAKLHVSGGEIRVDAGQAVTLDISNTMYLVGASNQLRLYNGGNPVVNITTGGNVGIGTTAPSYRLHVKSSGINSIPFAVQRAANTNNIFYVYEDSSGNGNLTVENSGGTVGVFLNSSGSSYFNGGNVGIGTTSPAYKLDVVGVINSSSAGVGTLNLGYLSTVSKVATSISGTESPSYSGTGKIGFSVNTWGVGSDYGLTEVMAIDMRGADTKSPTIWMNPFGGSVGIGTTTPVSSALSIQQDWVSGSTTVKVYPSTAMSSGGLAGYGIFDSNGTTRRAFLAATSSDFQIWGQSNVPMTFATNDTERMRITSGGLIGIGATSAYQDSNDRVVIVGGRLAINALSYNATFFNRSDSGIISEFATGGFGRGGLGFDGTDFTLFSRSGLLLQTDTSSTRVKIYTNGQIQFNTYTSSTAWTGTAVASLAVDSSGNIITTAVSSISGSGSAGQVTFWSGSSTQTGDNGLFWDNTNKRLGIGTTSPSELLEVVGNIRANVSNGGGFMLTGASASGLVRAGATGLALRTDTTDRLTIDNSGNVGIGTTSPGEKLDILGSGAQFLRIANVGTYLMRFGIDSSNNGFIGSSNATPIGFHTNGVNRLFITTDGNVGIGTTSPNLASANRGLSVNGTSSIVETNISDGRAGYLYSDGSFSILGEFRNLPLVFRTNDTERMRITSGGNLLLGLTSDFGYLLSVNGTSYFQGAALFNNTVVARNATTAAALGQFSVMGAGEFMSTGTLAGYFWENRSGGVTSSSNWYGWYTTSGVVHLYNGSVNLLGINGSTGAATFSNLAGTGTRMVVADANGLLSTQAIGSGAITGSGTTNYVPKFTGSSAIGNSLIYDDGTNVGIGNSSPGGNLDVQGASTTNVSYFRTNGAANRYILSVQNIENAAGVDFRAHGSTYSETLFGNSCTNASFIVGQPASGAVFAIGNVNNGPLVLATNNGERLRITSAGDVGIGTTSPVSGEGTPLTLVSSTGFVGLTLLGGGSYANTWQLYASGDGGSNKFFGIYDRTNSAYRLVTTSAGNVGIGTTSPTLGLHVADGRGFIVGPSASATGSMYVSPQDENTVNGGYGIPDDTADIWLNYRGYQDGFSYFRDTRIGNGKGTAIVMVDGSAGNVGIGTTSPAYKLDVSGQGRFSTTASEATIIAGGASLYNTYIANSVVVGYIGSGQGMVSGGGATNFGVRAEADLLFAAGGNTERLRITSAGNVGIGTTVPNRTLHVVGTARHERVYAYANNVFQFTNDTPQNELWLHLGTQGAFTTDKIYYRVNTNTSEEEGEIIVKNTCVKPNIEWNRNSYNVMVTAVKARMLGSCGACEIWIRVRYGSNYGGANTTVQWQVHNGTDASFATVNATGTPGTGTNESNISSTDGYFVANSDNLSVIGNVGIGTTAPVARLDVLSAVSATPITNGVIRIVGTGANPATGAGGGILLAQQDSVGNYVNYASITGRRVNNAANNIVNLDFNTGSPSDAIALATRMTITGNAGLVGIGTTGPDERLQVVGNINSTGGNNKIGFNTTDAFTANGGSTAHYGISYFGGANYVGVSGYFGLNFFSNGTERMRIDYSGNVGIGTTSPVAKLTVVGATTVIGQTNVVARFSDDINSTLLISHPASTSATATITGNEQLAFATGTVGSIAERLRITSAGDVGIGTTAPVDKLDVIGVLRVVMPSDPTTGAVTAKILSFSPAPFGLVFRGYETGAHSIQSQREANNAQLYPLSLQPLGGNVGIGTTAPVTKLQVVGGSISIDADQPIRKAGDNSIIGYSSTLPGINIGSGTATDMVAFNAGGTERVRINTSGNVGIGTTAPTEKLHVDGNIRTTQALISGGLVEFTGAWSASPYNGSTWIRPSAGVGVFLVNNAITRWAGFKPNDDFVVNSDNLLVQSSTGFVGIGTSSVGQKLHVDGGSLLVNTGTSSAAYRDIMIGGIGGWSGGESHGIDVVYGTASSPTTFSRIETHFDGTNGRIRFRNLFNASAPRTDILMTIQGNGNVGIGTDSPTYKFEVSDGTRTGVINPNASLDGIFIGVTQAKPLVFGTTDTERMRITSGGAVLIGSTDAAYGTFVAASNNSSAYTVASIRNMASGAAFGVQGAQLNFYGDVGYSSGVPTGFIKVISNEGGNNGHGAMTFGTHNGSNSSPERMRITSAGNVGIGTTAPSSKLHIDSALGADVISISDNAGSVRLALGQESSYTGNYIDSKNIDLKLKSALAGGSGGNIFFQTGTSTASTQVTINVSGNVGIGTTSPIDKLHIVGGVTSTSIATPSNTSVGSLQFGYDGTNGLIRSWNSSPIIYQAFNYQAWETSNSERMRITAAGNVGIGTTSPGYKLDVNGNIGATGVISETFWTNDSIRKLNSGASINFRNSAGTIEMILNGSGNLGIGTSTPSQKLDVQGNITITKTILSNQENLDVDSGATRVIATIASATYDGAFFDFVIKKGTNLRAGTVYSVHNGTTVEFTETSTNDLGNTSDVTLSVDLSGGNIRLLATTLSNDWIIKVLVRGI